MMAVLFFVFLLLQETFGDDPKGHFHFYGTRNRLNHHESTTISSLVGCASLSLSSLKTYFAFSNRTCFLMSGIVASEGHGNNGRGHVKVYKEASVKDVCPVAPALGNGTLVSLSGQYAGAEAVYRCNEGYSLCGHSNTSTCLDTGTWTPGVNCTNTETKWTGQAKLGIILPCDFKYGTTLKATVALTNLFSRSFQDINDRQFNIIMRSIFKITSKSITFQTMFNGKVSSAGSIRIKKSFKKNRSFKYVIVYTEKAFQIFLNGKQIHLFRHKTKNLPCGFSFYSLKGKMKIKEVTLKY